MAQTDAQIDVLLTDVSNALIPEEMIAEVLFPRLPVKLSSAILGKYGKGHLRVIDSRVVGRAKAPRVEVVTRDISTHYTMEEHGLEGLVTADDYRNVMLPFKAEEDETKFLSINLEVGKEVGLAATLADTAVITQNVTLAGADRFSDFQNSDPLEVFRTAQEAVRTGCGKYPDTAWMDKSVAKVLKRHPKLFAQLGIQYNQTGYMSDAQLAEALEVKRLLLTEGVYNSAKQGQADVLSKIWGKHLWFGVCPTSALPQQVSAGYYLTYEGEQPRQVTKWNENNPKGSTAILCTDNYCQLLSDATAIYGIFSAIA